MRIQEKIKEGLKQALKEKDKLRLETLRSLSAALVNELVALRRKPDEEIEDDLAIKVLKKAVKQRKEAAEQFKAGGREDLAEKEEKEAEIIKEFLPEEMPKEEIEKIIDECINEHGKDKSVFGALMSCAMKKVAGRADGSVVREILESKL